MKIMVLGYAQHGKDSVCNILRDSFGLTFVSSSFFCMDKCVRDYLRERGIVYDTADACYADRVNHRALWHDAIAAYNSEDSARLGRELLSQYDIYCGIRSKIELNALRAEEAYDVAFWVDASLRVAPEDFSSCKITDCDGDIIIDNNGPEENLKLNVEQAYKLALTLR